MSKLKIPLAIVISCAAQSLIAVLTFAEPSGSTEIADNDFKTVYFVFFIPQRVIKKRFSHERFLSWQTRDGIFIQRLPEFYYCYIFDRVQVTKVLMDENSFIFLFWQWQILTEFKSIEEIEAFITKITTKITIMFPTDGTFSMNPWKGFAGSFPFR